MPKVVMMSNKEKRCIEVATKIEKLMRFNRIDRHRLAKVIDASKSTVDNRLRDPSMLTLGEIWLMEDYFGCILTNPLQEKGGVFDEEPNH